MLQKQVQELTRGAPSYFSQFFETQLNENGDANLRTLYIDRDPGTFQDIARHLQGMPCPIWMAVVMLTMQDTTSVPRTAESSSSYSQTRNSTAVHLPLYPISLTQIDNIVPRLTSQLFESDIFVQIGGRQFQIPRDIFSSPGDSPNFFSLGFADFFASPSEVFPGLDRTGLLRPPAIQPPSVPNRSGDVFAELLHMLRGYPLEIRSAEHREQLLRDCRYYHLRGLEQRLIPHHISFHPSDEPRSEIIIRLEDLRPSGLDTSLIQSVRDPIWHLKYARPFTNETPHDLIIEIGNTTTTIDWALKLHFHGATRERIKRLIQLVLSKTTLQLPPLLENEDEMNNFWGLFETGITNHTDLTVDGEKADPTTLRIYTSVSLAQSVPPSRKRLRIDEAETMEWFVRRGQWRVVVTETSPPGTKEKEVKVKFVGVKLDVYTKERERNRTRSFLGS